MTISSPLFHPVRADPLLLNLTSFYGASYLLLVAVYSSYLGEHDTAHLLCSFYCLAIMLTYPALLLLPSLFLSWLTLRFSEPGGRHPNLTTQVVAVLGSNLIIQLVYWDTRLFDLYGFHFNGFVLNLVTTPGGIESLGGSLGTYVYFTVISLLFLILSISLMLVAPYVGRLLVNFGMIRKQLVTLVIVLGAISLGERTVFGIADVQKQGDIIHAASNFPLYSRLTFRSFAARLGIERPNNELGISGDSGKIHYPQGPLDYQDDGTEPPNIVWIVAESWRWDMLNEKIMPATTKKAHEALDLRNHYSGGNGTRQGMFSLFYGLYGSYWESFLIEKKRPVFFDVLSRARYQTSFYTSASFTYPEFDQTIFHGQPEGTLHNYEDDREPWLRDIDNTSRLISSIRDRDPNRPFMTFMFYESTHAPYSFPPDSALVPDYLETMNYATMSRSSLARDIHLVKNRYINSSHFLDSQLDRVFSAISDENLWDNTIVIVTGDHGEEFMEKGFWGHNSGFSEEQIRTPMLVFIPGRTAQKVERLTSHSDIIPTLLPLLGVTNPASDYTSGVSLFDPDARSYVVVSDWQGIAYVSPTGKFSIPFVSSLDTENQLSTQNDEVNPDPVKFLTKHKEVLKHIISATQQFTLDGG